MRPLILFLAGLHAVAGAATAQNGWQLIWSDEFNGPAGSPPDPSKWNYDLGLGQWFGPEIENYTNSTQNIFQDGNGNLVIRAMRDSNGNYTSGRIQTGTPGATTQTANGSWQYGLIEARMKVPFGQGVWPAFWMMGQDSDDVVWPICGEIDIMENYGAFLNNATVNNGTIHGPGTSAAYGIGTAATLPFGETVFDDYHVYAVAWSQDSVTFYLDGSAYRTLTAASLPTGDQWVYNAPFYILLNVAIGSPTSFLSSPDPDQPFPNHDLLVDYVRIYQSVPLSAQTPSITPGSVVNAASYLGSVAPGALAILSGSNLADNVHADTAGPNGSLLASLAGTTVTVGGVAAPLSFISPTQINFQIPWETTPGPAVPVQVTRGGMVSAIENITIAAAASPSMFLEDTTNGIAWMTGSGCETSECTAQSGNSYQLWANGLGPKSVPQQDGVSPSAALQVAGGNSACALTVGGIQAVVTYCGAAPGLVIDQVNFVYPSGVSTAEPYVDATLTVNGVTGRFRLPAGS